jgi:hypothetical protein
MSVILSRKDPFHPTSGARCTFCSEQLFVPFVHWAREIDIFICSDCAPGLRRGLTADLIQVDAIRELQRIGYAGMTFVRETTAAVDKRKEAEAIHMRVVHPLKPF